MEWKQFAGRRFNDAQLPLVVQAFSTVKCANKIERFAYSRFHSLFFFGTFGITIDTCGILFYKPNKVLQTYAWAYENVLQPKSGLCIY